VRFRTARQTSGRPARSGGTILAPMGFNPFRPQRRSAADYVMVAAALVICLALVVWAILG
jgi:hypothetical protein